MRHRHLNHEGYTLGTIDDVIERGKWQDWADLRRAALADASLFDKIEQVCGHRVVDPHAQRHHFWMHYVRHKRAAA